MYKRTTIKTPCTIQKIIHYGSAVKGAQMLRLMDINGKTISNVFVCFEDMEIDYVPKDRPTLTIKI